MDYPAYRAKGWDIGSGPTEAGCQVLGGRLKGSGMRWAEAVSAEVAALRALYASGEGMWDAFWQGRAPAPKAESTYKQESCPLRVFAGRTQSIGRADSEQLSAFLL
jgi:hypothetical protein